MIFIANKARPSPLMIEQAYDTNDAGAGIAWRDVQHNDHTPVVRWEKGLVLEDILNLAAKLPLPFVCHFRIPTVGGKRDSLCHPFPIHEDVPLDVKGITKGDVLFHNGHWSDWKRETFDVAKRFQIRLPEGKWSDSRAMAWAAYNYGKSCLELIDEKAVVFGPNSMDIYGSGWALHDEVIVSNKGFCITRHDNTDVYGSMGYNYNKPMCQNTRCTRRDLDDTGYCPDHTKKVIDILSKDIKVEKVDDKPVSSITSALTVLDKNKVPGGVPAESPFYQAWAMFNANQMSKSAFKKARKLYLKQMKKANRKEEALMILNMYQPEPKKTMMVH